MKTKSREDLLRISVLLLMVVVIAGTKTIRVEAAGALREPQAARERTITRASSRASVRFIFASSFSLTKQLIN